MQVIVGLALCAASVQANSLCLEGGFLGSIGQKICTIANDQLTKAEKNGFDLIQNFAKTAKEDFQAVTGTGANGTEGTGSSTEPKSEYETALKLGQDLVNFEATNNVATAGWNYVKTSTKDGFGAANAEFKEGPGRAMQDLTIGLGKGAVNTAVTFLPYNQWVDLGGCVVGKSSEKASETWLNKRDMLSALGTAARVAATGIDIMQECRTKAFNGTNTPIVFNVTQPDQQLGASLAKYAPMLTPVGRKATFAAVADKLKKKAFSLAIPGESSVGKVLKFAKTVASAVGQELPGSSLISKRAPNGSMQPVGQEFTYEEALTVRKAMAEQKDFLSSCVVGIDPNSSQDDVPTARLARRGAVERRQNIKRQAATGIAVLCPVPPQYKETPHVDIDVNPDVPNTADDIILAAGQSGDAPSDSDLPDAVAVYDTTYRAFEDADIVQAPSEMVVREDSEAGKADILADFSDRNSSSLAWSSKMTDKMPSDELWGILRKAFEATESAVGNNATNSDNFTRALGIYSSLASPGQLALTAGLTSGFMNSTIDDKNMTNLQAFTRLVFEHIKKAATDITGMKADDPALKDPKVSFYWTPPTDSALKSTERGVHAMSSTLSFIAEDVPGLAIALPSDKTKLYRPLLKPALWTVFPGFASSVKALGSAARHATFSGEAAKKGRVSMVVHV